MKVACQEQLESIVTQLIQTYMDSCLQVRSSVGYKGAYGLAAGSDEEDDEDENFDKD